jgi:hypothetical protein
VEIPLPNGMGENGTTNAGLLKLPVPTQEVHDTLKFHLKQSARAARLDERLQTAAGDTAIVEFLDTRPTEGLLWLAQANPEAAKGFLTTQVRSNPMMVAQELQAMGFTVTIDPQNERAITAEAQLAAERAKSSLQQGQSAFQQNLGRERFRQQALDVVEDMGRTLGFAKESEDHRIFTLRAAERMAEVYSTRGAQVTAAELVQALQPLVQAMTRATSTPAPSPAGPGTHPSQQQPRVPAGKPDGGQFTALQQKNDKFRKLAGPAATGAPPAVTKIKPDMSLYDLRGDRR